MARANGVEELLPYTSKGTEVRRKRRAEQGLRVKGTGVGQRVKGKGWERTMKARLEKRRQAMLGMPRLVQQWKQVCLDFLFCLGAGELGLMMMGADVVYFIVGAWAGVEEVAEVRWWFGWIDWVICEESGRP